LRSVKL